MANRYLVNVGIPAEIHCKKGDTLDFYSNHENVSHTILIGNNNKQKEVFSGNVSEKGYFCEYVISGEESFAYVSVESGGVFSVGIAIKSVSIIARPCNSAKAKVYVNSENPDLVMVKADVVSVVDIVNEKNLNVGSIEVKSGISSIDFSSYPTGVYSIYVGDIAYKVALK